MAIMFSKIFIVPDQIFNCSIFLLLSWSIKKDLWVYIELSFSRSNERNSVKSSWYIMHLFRIFIQINIIKELLFFIIYFFFLMRLASPIWSLFLSNLSSKMTPKQPSSTWNFSFFPCNQVISLEFLRVFLLSISPLVTQILIRTC